MCYSQLIPAVLKIRIFFSNAFILQCPAILYMNLILTFERYDDFRINRVEEK